MENRELMHYGVKGMRWGHRKTYRSAVKTANSAADAARKETLKNTSRIGNSTYQRHRKANVAANKAYMDSMKKSKAEAKAARVSEKNANPNKGLSDKQKKAVKVGAAAAGTVLAAYGAYKLVNMKSDKIMLARGEANAKRFINDNTIREMKVGKDTATFTNGMGFKTNVTFKNGVNANQAAIDYKKNFNNAVVDRASEIKRGVRRTADNMTFKQKSRNVYDYYRKKYR